MPFVLNRVALATALGLAAVTSAAAGAGTASGTVNYTSKVGTLTMAPKFAYLVVGPDAVDPGKKIRHLILSATDMGAKLTACQTMSCTDADLGSGMTVDLDAGPRLNYWLVLNGQKVQYSGTEPPASLKLTGDSATRLAGTLAFDGAAAGGPQVAVEFDAPLVKEMTKAR